MSYRYPHADDSDENGFAESLQVQPSTSVPGQAPLAAYDSDGDVFEEATEEDSDGESDAGVDEEDDDDDDDDEFHGLCTLHACLASPGIRAFVATDPR